MHNLLDNPLLLLMGLGLPLVSLVVVAFVGYWVIRFAVRHGVLDARRRGSAGSLG